ncbi:MAG: hypothetical protein EA401_04745 [Planctomycetota bacterium]|nr:MAG: hypothetical protein EA401_04745 [Planctomycetota bacterium]
MLALGGGAQAAGPGEEAGAMQSSPWKGMRASRGMLVVYKAPVEGVFSWPLGRAAVPGASLAPPCALRGVGACAMA